MKLEDLEKQLAVVNGEIEMLSVDAHAIHDRKKERCAERRRLEAAIKVAQMPAEEVAAISQAIKAMGIESAEEVNGGEAKE